MGKYNVGEVWWIHFPFGDKDYEKRRPAIVVDDAIMEKNDDIIAFVKTKCL